MRIWLIGAANKGVVILTQLQKNPEIDIIISDSSPRPRAVVEGVIEKVDYQEMVTPMNVNALARRIRPDLILIDSTADSRNLGRLTGGLALSDALMQEIVATSEYPCIVI